MITYLCTWSTVFSQENVNLFFRYLWFTYKEHLKGLAVVCLWYNFSKILISELQMLNVKYCKKSYFNWVSIQVWPFDGRSYWTFDWNSLFSYLQKIHLSSFFFSQNQRIPSDMVFLRTSEKTGMFSQFTLVAW